MVILYNIFLIFIFPLFILVFGTLSIFIKKWRKGFFRKMGNYSGKPHDEKNVICHCVSVGETLSAVPLIKKVVSAGEKDLIFTVTTHTGWNVSNTSLSAIVKAIEFFPFDFPYSLSRFFNFYNPKAMIIVETELWPNMIFFAKKYKVPVIFVNGRISDRSFPRYMYARWFFKSFMDYPFFMMQTEKDKERIIKLGADPAKVFVMGNIKYDFDKKGGIVTRAELGILPDDVVLIAGSTHPGEEEVILSSFVELRTEFKKLKLILAPRHPERFEDVKALIKQKGIIPSLRSKRDICNEIYLLDTVGELFGFYEIADIAFVGGSLANIGGHNIIEPAYFAKPVIFGPHMQNFRDMSMEFLGAGAALSVTSEELTSVLKNMISDPAMRSEIGNKAKSLVDKNKGSVNKTHEFLSKIIPHD